MAEVSNELDYLRDTQSQLLASNYQERNLQKDRVINWGVSDVFQQAPVFEQIHPFEVFWLELLHSVP